MGSLTASEEQMPGVSHMKSTERRLGRMGNKSWLRARKQLLESIKGPVKRGIQWTVASTSVVTRVFLLSLSH